MSKDPSLLDFWNRSAHGPEWPEVNPNFRPAKHDHGVAFFAPWEEVFAGFPEHARRCAVSLASTGIPLHLRSAGRGAQFQLAKDVEQARAYDAMRDELKPLLDASIRQYDAEIWQVIGTEESIHRLGSLRHHWMTEAETRSILSRRVVSTVFERDRITDSSAEALRNVAQVWVANAEDKRMLARHRVERVHVIPVPYYPNDPLLSLAGRPRRPGVPRFYHIGKWEPRKEQRNILLCFLRAFRPGEAQLYIKTSSQSPDFGDYPRTPDQAIDEALGDNQVKKQGWNLDRVNRDIFRIRHRLSSGRILALHKQCDVYVTLSRGEGFDMPAFDAKLAGNLMVYTPSGGPQDFAHPADFTVLVTDRVPCHPWYRWPKDARYIDYDLEDAVACLRAAADMVHKNIARTTNDHLQSFRADVVGQKMRKLIDEVRGA